MNILLLGGGGREHALAWAMAQNPKCDRIYCAPGNAGIAALAECLSIDICDGAAVVSAARQVAAGLVVIGPEAPLVAGVADTVAAAGIPVFGPSAAAARLEASKTFTKELCAAAGVPTARWASFTSAAGAMAHLATHGAPMVVKADGLAAGKGVTVAETQAEAEAAVAAIFAGGPARAVLEEKMTGEEASLFVLADGAAALVMGTAQDHKRAFDGDAGPNTGGMGAYSPAPVMTARVTARAMAEIVRPTLSEMVRRGTPFRGVLYAGLMIEAGAPRLVEYNVRFGDPECQALMLRLGAQALDAMLAVAEGRLAELRRLNWACDHALCVVLAARGYPGAYTVGEAIGGLGGEEPGVEVFHSGTQDRDGRVVSAGGRVLSVTARGASLAEARDRAYGRVARIDWPGGAFRRDIGWRALLPEDR